ncbi:Na+/Pi-cotransporter [compost metagenome]
MTMGLVGTGTLPIELGIAMVIGSNVGTCATALIASIGGSKSGRFVAWSHVTLNLGGALLFLPLTSQLAATVSWITSDPATQIAHSQTLFNVVCSLIALPICYFPFWKRIEANDSKL